MGHGERVLTDEGVELEDIDGTFAESEFFEYVGTKMRMSGSSSHKRFLVFWSEDDDELDSTSIRSRSPSARIDNWVIKDKIRRALEHVDLAYSPSLLAQFWAPLTIGDRLLLQTWYQPFGMTYLGKGLSSFRKLSWGFHYSCSSNNGSTNGGRIDLDDGRESIILAAGPPSRVFINGLPEYSPDVEFYSDKEYPLRADALRRKIKNYMAVPVFVSNSQRCVGVLELVSSTESKGEMDKPAYVFGLMSTALQGVGLCTSGYTCHFDVENHLAQTSTGRANALGDIRMALEDACMKHNLPFAQIWTNMESKGCIPYALSTTSDEYYQSHLDFSIFRDTCESFHLTFGVGVVWKAFGAAGACFCRDVGQLSIADYSFSHVARKVMLTASFAICLKSHHETQTGHPDHVYVLELFLPSATANPQELLEHVLLTMKKRLNGFIIGSGQKLGGEINVEVLRVSEDDNQEFFRLYPDSASGSIGLLDHNSSVSTQPTLDQQSGLEQHTATDNVGTGISEYQESLGSFVSDELFANDASISNSGWREEYSSNTPSMKETGSSYNTSSLSTSRFPNKDYMVEDQHTTACTLVGGEVDFFETKKGNNSAIALHQIINLETIEKHYGLKLKDAASSLKVSTSTLKRRCRDAGISSWPRKKSNATCPAASIDSTGKYNEMNERKYDDGGRLQLFANKDTTSSKHHTSQVAALPINHHTSPVATLPIMTIKARYQKNIIIKFQLPFSSPLLLMKLEIASRLTLEIESFKIWYLDEDDEFILLTCDADLRTMESMGKSTIRVSITEGDSVPK